MKLKDKAAAIDFGDLDSPAETNVPKTDAPPVDRAPQRERARSGVAAISQSISMHHRVKDLEGQLARFEDAKLVVMLDPKLIAPSRWRNRHEMSFTTKEFEALKQEIESAGRNVQPIKVRRVKGDEQERYEIVYGRRRHRACLELSLPVAAVVEELSDVELFREMDRENRQRADLSPWEQGVMYRDALDQGLFSSLRQMAGSLGVDPGNVSKALKLASLPEEVVRAFVSPLDLQYRWAGDLTTAFETDPSRLLAAAAALSERVPRAAAKEVLATLLGHVSPSGVQSTEERHELRSGEKVVGSWSIDGKGATALKLKPGSLSASKQRKLLEFVERLIQ